MSSSLILHTLHNNLQQKSLPGLQHRGATTAPTLTTASQYVTKLNSSSLQHNDIRGHSVSGYQEYGTILITLCFNNKLESTICSRRPTGAVKRTTLEAAARLTVNLQRSTRTTLEAAARDGEPSRINPRTHCGVPIHRVILAVRWQDGIHSFSPDDTSNRNLVTSRMRCVVQSTGDSTRVILFVSVCAVNFFSLLLCIHYPGKILHMLKHPVKCTRCLG